MRCDGENGSAPAGWHSYPNLHATTADPSARLHHLPSSSPSATHHHPLLPPASSLLSMRARVMMEPTHEVRAMKSVKPMLPMRAILCVEPVPACASQEDGGAHDGCASQLGRGTQKCSAQEVGG